MYFSIISHFLYFALLSVFFERINSDLCRQLKRIKPETRVNLKFIQMGTKNYIYLLDHDLDVGIYPFTPYCVRSDNGCEYIGLDNANAAPFNITPNFRNSFRQDQITFFINDVYYKRAKVWRYGGDKMIDEIEEQAFLDSVDHSTVYDWKALDGVNNKKMVSVFIPTKSSNRKNSDVKYSVDIDFNTIVELNGYYDNVYIRDEKYYSFGDHFIPFRFDGYFELPNGDEIFTYGMNYSYVTRNGIEFEVYDNQDLNFLLKCSDEGPKEVATNIMFDRSKGKSIYQIPVK